MVAWTASSSPMPTSRSTSQTRPVVDAFLPPPNPRQRLDPAAPVTIGAMVGPEAFTEVRWLADWSLRRAIEELPALEARWRSQTGRAVQAVTRHGPLDARTVVVSLGSVSDTVTAAIAELADIARLVLTLYRPFPHDAVRAALRDAEHVIVLERAFAPGAGGVITPTYVPPSAGLPVRFDASASPASASRQLTRTSIARTSPGPHRRSCRR